MTIVDSIIQKHIPIAEVNKPVIIDFEFNTNDELESTNAKIKAIVAPGGIITDMTNYPPGSIFVQSHDKQEASVNVTGNSYRWDRDRSITLQFQSLPSGNMDYIVGTLYYYNSNDIFGPGIPLTVKLGSKDVYPKLMGTGTVLCQGRLSLNHFLLDLDFISGHVYSVIFSHPIDHVQNCRDGYNFDIEHKVCIKSNPVNVEFLGEGFGLFKVLTSGSAAQLHTDRFTTFDYEEEISVTLWDYGFEGDDIQKLIV